MADLANDGLDRQVARHNLCRYCDVTLRSIFGDPEKTPGLLESMGAICVPPEAVVVGKPCRFLSYVRTGCDSAKNVSRAAAKSPGIILRACHGSHIRLCHSPICRFPWASSRSRIAPRADNTTTSAGRR